MATEADRVLGDDGEFHAAAEAVVLPKYGFEDWIAFGLFWLLALDVFYQFFTRYVLEDSAAWTEEIARYLLITVVFIGGSMAVRRNTHIHVEFLFRYFPARFSRALSNAVDLVRIATLGYLTYLAAILMPKMENLKMTVIDWPMSYIYGFVMVGFAMMTIRSVQVAIRHYRQGWSALERPSDDDTGDGDIVPGRVSGA